MLHFFSNNNFNACKNNVQFENIGIQELSARLQKALNHLTTTLMRCLSNAREHVANSGKIRQKTTMTAEVQGNYPNFKQNLVQKENFVISKVNGSQTLFSKGCLSSKVPKIDKWELSKEQRIRKQKSSQKAFVFSIIIFRKLDQKFFGATPRSHGHLKRLKDNSRHTLEVIFRVMRAAVKISQRAKTI